LGNAQRPLENLWAILKEKKGKDWEIPDVIYYERRKNCPAAIGEKVLIFVHILCSTAFLFIFIKKQRHIEKM
jgi:hypothetical protein